VGLQLVTGPAVPPVTRTTAKAHLHVEHTDDDDLIDTYIAAETAFAESFTGRALVSQEWDYYQDAFPAECDPQEIRLPLGKVLSVSAVYYLDAGGTEQTLDAANYDVDLASVPARVTISATGTWPTTYDGVNAVRARFTAGQEDTGVSPAEPDVLKDIQLAILLRVQADYDGGEAAKGLREASEIYLKRRRVHLALA
jgi:uncharacterized phiE125 gp8 family phage protein